VVFPKSRPLRTLAPATCFSTSISGSVRLRQYKHCWPRNRQTFDEHVNRGPASCRCDWLWASSTNEKSVLRLGATDGRVPSTGLPDAHGVFGPYIRMRTRRGRELASTVANGATLIVVSPLIRIAQTLIGSASHLKRISPGSTRTCRRHRARLDFNDMSMTLGELRISSPKYDAARECDVETIAHADEHRKRTSPETAVGDRRVTKT